MTLLIVKRRPTDADWRRVLVIAAKAEPEVARLLMRAFRAVQDEIPIVGLGKLIAEGDFGKALDLIPLDKLSILESELPKALRDVLEASGERGARLVTEINPKIGQIRFDVFNPKAVQWMRSRGAELVREISDQTRQAIKDLISRAFQEGIPPLPAGKLIRDLVGLNSRQWKAVENFRAMMQSEGIKGDKLNERVSVYARRQLRYRARMIARTETKTAANMGQQMVWEQAQSEGFLGPQARKFWLLSADPCPKCIDTAARNNSGVPVSGMFMTPFGPKLGPALHVHCRCGMSVRPFAA